jgi:hypothetical protein
VIAAAKAHKSEEPVRVSLAALDLPILRHALQERVHVHFSRADLQRVRAGAAAVARLVARGATVYGLNTGFGLLARTRIPRESDKRPAEESRSVARRRHRCAARRRRRASLLVLKIASLVKGYSGVRLETVQALAALLEHEVYPCIPGKGSVGASGDLAPLAHMSAVLLGVGHVRVGGASVRGARPEARGPEAPRAWAEGGARAAERHPGVNRFGALGAGADRERVCRGTRKRRPVGRCLEGQRCAVRCAHSCAAPSARTGAMWPRRCAACSPAAAFAPRI